MKATALFLGSMSRTDPDLLAYRYALYPLGIIVNDNLEAVTLIHEAGGFPIVIEVLQQALLPASDDDMLELRHKLLSLLWIRKHVLLENNEEEKASTLISEMIDCGVIPSILYSIDDEALSE